MGACRLPAKFFAVAFAAAAMVSAPGIALPQTPTAALESSHAGILERIGVRLPLEVPLRDHTGKSVKLGDYFDGTRPIVLTFAYHSCPVVCSMVLSGVVSGLRDADWTVGKDFDVLTISIDPDDSLEQTSAKRASILKEYGRGRAHDGHGWHFLLGDEESVAKVAAAAGFSYQYDFGQKQWSHPAALMIADPGGVMSRYFYGIEFAPRDVQLALLEASGGGRTLFERARSFAYRYDSRRAAFMIASDRLALSGGALAIFVGCCGLLWRRSRKRR